MAKVNVNLESAKKLKSLDKRMAKKLGETTVREMKRLISQGVSPVRGEGRFERYKRQGQDDGYPNSVRDRFPNKKQRPVNLYLNGWYLSYLTWWFNAAKNYVGIGFSSKEGVKQPVPKKVLDYFRTHNEGDHPHVPQRKHLPNGEGDVFAVSVERRYRGVAEKEIARIIKEQNKK